MRLLNADSVQFLRGIVKMRPAKNVENLIWLRCKLRHIDVLKQVYSEICVIRVQIFILVSLLCEFVTFRRKKYSVVIYEQIRFCEIKSN